MPLATVLSDDSASYPTPSGNRLFDSLDGSSYFTYPRERTVCWDDGVGGLDVFGHEIRVRHLALEAIVSLQACGEFGKACKAEHAIGSEVDSMANA